MQNTIPSATIFDTIITDLNRNQKPYRVLHIFGVLQTSLSLGTLYNADLEKLSLAALLHDCAKDVGREETLKLADESAISLSSIDKNYPAIWHGTVAAYFAQSRYGVQDEEVLQAVEHHTLGCSHPSLLLQILMCADYCEPTRQQAGVSEIRNLVRTDLKKGLLAILHLKIEDLIKKDQKPHPGIYSTIESLET